MSTQKNNPISTAEAAILIGCTARCVRQMLVDGRLSGQRIGLRTWIVERKSAENMRENPAKMGRPRKSLSKFSEIG